MKVSKKLLIVLVFLFFSSAISAQNSDVIKVKKHFPIFYGETITKEITINSQRMSLENTNPVLKAKEDFDKYIRNMIAIAGFGTIIPGVKKEFIKRYLVDNI